MRSTSWLYEREPMPGGEGSGPGSAGWEGARACAGRGLADAPTAAAVAVSCGSTSQPCSSLTRSRSKMSRSSEYSSPSTASKRTLTSSPRPSFGKSACAARRGRLAAALSGGRTEQVSEGRGGERLSALYAR